ncbi:hypothetical protein GCM10010440_76560 [Kitasatospora cinereorecta]
MPVPPPPRPAGPRIVSAVRPPTGHHGPMDDVTDDDLQDLLADGEDARPDWDDESEYDFSPRS